MREWNEALEAAMKILAAEAENCQADIVDGDELGKQLALARVGALLTAVGDIRELYRQ